MLLHLLVADHNWLRCTLHRRALSRSDSSARDPDACQNVRPKSAILSP